MTVNDIYTHIFPIGGIDSNNRYIDMSQEDLSTVQLLEPVVSVSEFVIAPQDRSVKYALPDRSAYRIPMISINDVPVKMEMILDFYLDYSYFTPTCMVEIIDFNNEMLSTNSIRDGAIIKVYIGGNGDELYYKPIRQDFVITNIIKTDGGNQNLGEWITYRFTGSLNVPMGYKKESWSNSPATSLQELFNLAIYTGIGFATNFTETPIDKMRWENTLGVTYFDFMKNIAEHACYSPNTFFTAFVDQYYVLNFVECHRLLSHGGKKTDVPGMIYLSTPQIEEPNVTKTDGKNHKTTDQLIVDTDTNEEDLYNPFQKVSYYFITNDLSFRGWTNYIESYNEINDGYSSMDDGYRKHLIYSDSNIGNWGSNSHFTIYPIDNLERDGTTQMIKDLPDEVKQETYVPLNLIHMNNEEYNDSSITTIDKMSEVESYVQYGEVDTSNTYKLYYFAEIQNEYQMKFMKKCGLKVVLENYNPAVTKFSRIWVDIYDTNTYSMEQIMPYDKERIYRKNDPAEFSAYKQTKSDNVIHYDDEGVYSQSGSTKNKFNRSLSGWYVVTSIKYVYDSYSRNIKTHLILNRIEHKPLFKNEYNVVRDSIKKYKEDNKVEYLYKNIDDYSY